jgi:hypothetical protein
MHMGHLQSQAALIALWVVAGLTMVWIVGPLLLFLSPLRKHTIAVREDPTATQPDGKDADYARCFAELTARGFVPLGKTIERCPFLTPLHWRWISSGSRWLASPDGRVHVALHRLAAGHPLRISAHTTFEGGGLLVTSTTATGLGGEIGERYRRVEVGNEGPAEVVHQHERHVDEFCRVTGLRARPATLAEIAPESIAIDKPFTARHRLASTYAIAFVYLMPVWSLLTATRAHRASLVVPIGLCMAALLFATLRIIALPEFRRFRWVGFIALMLLGFAVPLTTRLMPRHHSAQPAAQRR